MKKWMIVFRVVILLAIVAAAFYAGRIYPALSPSDSPPVLIPPSQLVHTDSVPTIEAVQRLSSLMVTRVAVADVSQTQINGYAGGITAVIVIRGDFLLGVDLSKAKFEKINEAERSVVLVLTPPTVSSPRLDQDKTRLLYLTRQGLWSIVPGDAGQKAVVNQAYRHAQEVVAAVGRDPMQLEEARQHAESTLSGFFAAIGCKVTIRWTDRPEAHSSASNLNNALIPKYNEAKKIYDKLVKEKTAKGYSPGAEGTPYQQTDKAERATGVLPQLLNPIDESELDRYLANDNFWILDGGEI
jgi:Protein of unknown function (DUF4230)